MSCCNLCRPSTSPPDCALSRPTYSQPRSNEEESEPGRIGDRATAIHEAAHAVFAVAGSHFVDHATIVSGRDYLGEVRCSGPKKPGFIESKVLLLQAGPYAEGLYEADIDPLTTPSRRILADHVAATAQAMIAGDCDFPCSRDDCKTLFLLKLRRPDVTFDALMSDMDRAVRHVGALLRQPGVWSAVQEVANLLERVKTCSDHDIRPIVGKWLGNSTLRRLSIGIIPNLLPR